MRLPGTKPSSFLMKQGRSDPIALALEEDIGEGDITTEFFVSETLRSIGRIVAKEKATVAGIQTTTEVFRQVDPSIQIQSFVTEGTEVNVGETVIELHGSSRSILRAERVA